MTEKFKKFDSGKIDYSLFEPTVMQMYCEVAQMGAAKYGVKNWQKATISDISRYEAAMLRHFMAYMSGELTDKESGLSHLSHALWNIAAIAYIRKRDGDGSDNL